MEVPTPEELAQEQWHQLVDAVATAMSAHVPPFITPIARAITFDYGELEGSGSYIEFAGKRFLMTNEHVARALKRNSLSHQFHNCPDHFRARNGFITKSEPQDIGVSPIDDEVWNHSMHEGVAIPECRLAPVHQPVDGELFFMCGFAGQNARFHFGHLLARYTPYTVQEPHPRTATHAYHFALAYNPERAQTVGRGPGLPNPHGFSGALIWNTKRVEYLHLAKEWSPEVAQVTGIVHTWDPDNSCLIATRIEEIIRFLREDVPRNH